ncbi:asparaginase domain-containing protein [Algimonas porphyrae]|uniref:Asparaginase n=1 Tax=Algimonas porphyrae TaxID=1128113 RepID=A0ABQ5UXM2_9PROT|nr:asparaginase domain-containing protein [Algimonas porphyrae]GLQ19903.1 asparaginase [Algimonas porphyrae]
MDILILTTGGTIDKVHDVRTERLVFDGSTAVSDILKYGRTDFPRVQSLMSIDSLDMSEDHRDAILQAVINAPENHIVVTHGTGTMEQTAHHLNGNIGQKTVVLSGAMRPQSLWRSDAEFNLGGAVIAAQTLPAGVYAVMNGRVIKARNVRKDLETGRFV